MDLDPLSSPEAVVCFHFLSPSFGFRAPSRLLLTTFGNHDCANLGCIALGTVPGRVHLDGLPCFPQSPGQGAGSSWGSRPGSGQGGWYNHGFWGLGVVVLRTEQWEGAQKGRGVTVGRVAEPSGATCTMKAGVTTSPSFIYVQQMFMGLLVSARLGPGARQGAEPSGAASGSSTSPEQGP